MEWINVNYRLPEVNEHVLVIANKLSDPKPIAIARLINEEYRIWDLRAYLHTCECKFVEDLEVTHWAPLPVFCDDEDYNE